MTRADCIDGPRPCPWVGCRLHLAIEVAEDGTLYNRHNSSRIAEGAKGGSWFVAGVLRTLAGLKETCALDVARWLGASLGEIAALMGTSKFPVFEAEAEGLALVRALIEEGKAN